MAALFVIPALIVISGCASSSGGRETQASRMAAGTTGAAGATGPSRAVASARTSPLSAVRQYYELINKRRLNAAWRRLSPQLQADLGGYETWQAGYKFTTDTKLLAAKTVTASHGVATVQVRFVGKDLDACGNRVSQDFAGSWDLRADGSAWLATAARVAKLSGGDVVRDVADCQQPSRGGSPRWLRRYRGGRIRMPRPSHSYVPPPPPPATPAGGFCSIHDCIPNYSNGNGYTVQCADGTYSHSGGIQGACSYHGGEAGYP